mmetsp:Transcript_56247/g.163069  ORF Transcript_56247/g.163069 Transcript_56247/m.163069 type:complete len:235 (-) Transcript_56247:866-1570(-)
MSSRSAAAVRRRAAAVRRSGSKAVPSTRRAGHGRPGPRAERIAAPQMEQSPRLAPTSHNRNRPGRQPSSSWAPACRAASCAISNTSRTQAVVMPWQKGCLDALIMLLTLSSIGNTWNSTTGTSGRASAPPDAATNALGWSPSGTSMPTPSGPSRRDSGSMASTASCWRACSNIASSSSLASNLANGPALEGAAGFSNNHGRKRSSPARSKPSASSIMRARSGAAAPGPSKAWRL